LDGWSDNLWLETRHLLGFDEGWQLGRSFDNCKRVGRCLLCLASRSVLAGIIVSACLDSWCFTASACTRTAASIARTFAPLITIVRAQTQLVLA
jgi:hypothetical protein